MYEIRKSKLDKEKFEVWHKPTGNRVLSLIPSQDELNADGSRDFRLQLQAEIDSGYDEIQGMKIRETSFDGWCIEKGVILAKGLTSRIEALKQRRFMAKVDQALV